MQRSELEHILRAAGAITGADRFVVIGSQAILGQFPDAPAELLVSMEADVFSLRSTEDSELIDGTIGELSPFHQNFGYYAHGVGEETAVLPSGWQDRLVAVKTPATGGTTGLCLEVHDLAVSKLVAGREKDVEFVGSLFRHGLAKASVVRQRLDATTFDDRLRGHVLARVERAAGEAPGQ
jgi:hypothetical protein